MKTYCKNVDITDPETIMPWVFQALDHKWKKREFVRLILRYGRIGYHDLESDISSQRYAKRLTASQNIASEVARRIRMQDLRLSPLRAFQRVDGLSGKTRDLCKASPMQQIMDYVAVGALGELLRAKIAPHQYASIPGRGQEAGKARLEKWIRRDKQSRHAIKGDVKKCYASLTRKTVIRLLRRDIGKNKTLLWFLDNLLRTHSKVTSGMAIGSYLSQWLCNYALSYLYRYADGLHRIRHRKNGTEQRVRLVRHILFYMDDFILIGPRAADVEKAMRLVSTFALEKLGLSIKQERRRIDLQHGSVDMMGFVVGYLRTTIRRRIFRRLRRQFLRAAKDLEQIGFIPFWRARKIASYNGYFKHTDTHTAAERIQVGRISRAAGRSIAFAERKGIA